MILRFFSDRSTPYNNKIVRVAENNWREIWLIFYYLQHFSNETVQKAYLATEENPFDMDAWNVLLRELQTRKIEDVRPLFEKLAKIFPTTGRFWKMYIEQEVRFF